MKQPHILYITTASMTYYPVAGTYDWVYCGPSYDDAFAAYINSKADETSLVGIAADGTHTTLMSY